ncbi:MAG TPA: hypothetical protein VF221_04130, partial [Chloroflexota bacterium]
YANGLLAWIGERVEEQSGSEERRREERLSYQTILRTIGAWLDSRNAANANVIEAPSAFVVRYVLGDDPRNLQEHILSGRELRELEAAMREHRMIQRNGRYQDLWRALGFEIDEREGTNLLLDQVEESLLVSYLYQKPETGLSWNKYASLLGQEDQAVMLRRAYARRRVVEQPRALRHRLFRRGEPARQAQVV